MEVLIAQFRFEEKAVVWQAAADYSSGQGDFSDCLLGRVAKRAGCDMTFTFDKGLKRNPHFRVL